MKLLWLALVFAAPVGAAELRDLCADRPGLGTPPCIVDRGHLLVEAGIADFTHDRQPDVVSDSFTAGDLLLRYGVGERLEVFGGWTAFTHDRERDRVTREVTRTSGVGDMVFGLKQSLANPDGSGISVAVQPFVTAPTATHGVGEGGWTQGLIVPISIELPAKLTLELSPEIDRLSDENSGGHHLACTGVVGLTRALGAVDAQVELLVSRDDEEHATQAIADVNLGWTIGDDLQLDAEVDAGLNRAAPGLRVAIGVSRRF